MKFSNELRILAAIVFLSILTWFFTPSFFSWDNWSLFLRINSAIGVVSFGMLLVILTGGIDVSVAANIAVTASVVAFTAQNFAPPLPVLFALALIVGALFGTVNGLLITTFKITPIIITLSTLNIGNGILFYMTQGNWFNKLPQNYKDFGDIVILNLPIQVIVFLGVGVFTHIFLKYTVFGRTIYALGSNVEAAERQGLPVKSMRVFVYSYVGFLSGLGAILYSSIVKQVIPTSFNGFEMSVISIVVLGGASILGGTGNIMGNILGWVLLAVINNAIILMRVPVYWQSIVLAGILLIVVIGNAVMENVKRLNKKKIDLGEDANGSA